MVQDLIQVGFIVEFQLDHLGEIAQAFLTKKVQPVVDTIDAHIESLKKEVANLKASHERLFSGATSPSCFRNHTFISGL